MAIQIKALIGYKGGFHAKAGKTYTDADIPAGMDIVVIEGDVNRPNKDTHITIREATDTTTNSVPIPFEKGRELSIVTGYEYTFAEDCVVSYGTVVFV